MSKNKAVFWIRPDIFNNRVSFYEDTWNDHASKHAYDDPAADEEHFYETIVDPDSAHISLDDVIGNECCVFKKFFEAENAFFIVPVTCSP